MSLTPIEVEMVEAGGQELLRRGVAKEGLALLALALKYRQYSVRVPERFACHDIDESAGQSSSETQTPLARVIPISRKD